MAVGHVSNIVATGRLLESYGERCKVVVTVVHDGAATLPYTDPDNGIFTVIQAAGTQIIWPRDFVITCDNVHVQVMNSLYM